MNNLIRFLNINKTRFLVFLGILLLMFGLELIFLSKMYTDYHHDSHIGHGFIYIPLREVWYRDKVIKSMDTNNTDIVDQGDIFPKDMHDTILARVDEKLVKAPVIDIEQPAGPLRPPFRQILKIKDIKVSKDNIFFVETKCATKKTALKHKAKCLLLDARQSCAVESTAVTNPDKEIYLMYSCPLVDECYECSPEHARKIMGYPNVHLVHLNMSEVFQGSPAQELYEKNLLETSSYPLEHTSDVLRYTLLWKFGGTYSDLDVVTIRSFSGLKTNWAGKQDHTLIASGVMNFSPLGEGHAIAEAALSRLAKNFDGRIWGANGPKIVTATVLAACNVSSVNEAMENCTADFTVLDSNILYPIYYPLHRQLFEEKNGPEVVKTLKSTAYSVHIWNKMSHDSVVRVGSTQAYSLLANEFCPEVYKSCGDEF